jgi:purine-binding chemotaxis protein CheW
MSELIGRVIEAEEDTQKDKYLIFTLGKESYGIEIQYVTEIISLQAITTVPKLPVYVKGIINLRGKIIPVMDMRLRFKMDTIAYNERTCVIIIEMREEVVGLIVDGVSEVMTITEQELAEPPQLNKAYSNNFIKKIGKVGSEIKLLLDCEKLLNEEELTESSVTV